MKLFAVFCTRRMSLLYLRNVCLFFSTRFNGTYRTTQSFWYDSESNWNVFSMGYNETNACLSINQLRNFLVTGQTLLNLFLPRLRLSFTVYLSVSLSLALGLYPLAQCTYADDGVLKLLTSCIISCIRHPGSLELRRIHRWIRAPHPSALFLVDYQQIGVVCFFSC